MSDAPFSPDTTASEPTTVSQRAWGGKLPRAADFYEARHNGTPEAGRRAMLARTGCESMKELIAKIVPEGIRRGAFAAVPEAAGEGAALAELRKIAEENRPGRAFIGQGFYGTRMPPVIQRNVFESPGWLTAYTPYQAEISQGRLELLLGFQTLAAELTGLPAANASMLDEATAAAEAMALCFRTRADAAARVFFVSEGCHPQTVAVVRTRARPMGVEVVVGDEETFEVTAACFGGLAQYPDTRGDVKDFTGFFGRLRAVGAKAVVAADPLALVLLRPPGEFGADIAVGSAQRFGMHLGFGGPAAAFFAAKEGLRRQLPGRLVGISRDAAGREALRLALGTREQHIRRDKATSNICTAQALPAMLSTLFAEWHGPEGLRAIARRVKLLTDSLREGLRQLGFPVNAGPVFDTVTVETVDAEAVHARAEAAGMVFRRAGERLVGVSLDELAEVGDVDAILGVFAGRAVASAPVGDGTFAGALARDGGGLLRQAAFNSHHTEHGMLRRIRRLEAKDLSLCHSMISLGSCTMKLNPTASLLPLSWEALAGAHPFLPEERARGWARIRRDLEAWLADIAGMTAVSLQPNSGAAGEFAGLLAIRNFHEANGEGRRDVCLIPASAHGTNPASAALCGLTVVNVACDAAGNVDTGDLRAKAEAHGERLAALMLTYPSTHGVFEENARELCSVVHARGGQVYMDGANMNAQCGLTSPGEIGADICHLNLHKTFGLPHGGGGPGVGPVAARPHLAAHLPREVAGAPLGNALLLAAAWMYVRMMGGDGLRRATELAMLNANYIAARLDPYFPVLYKGRQGFVAHECILDLRPWKARGIEAEDVAKRLMDYGFHAPTLSFPVPGTLMVEPTESETPAELDRFCDAMVAIHGEMVAVAEGRADRQDNVLKNAPHTAAACCAEAWGHAYSREAAAFPAAWTREAKFWPAVGRVDNVWGDRNLRCSL